MFPPKTDFCYTPGLSQELFEHTHHVVAQSTNKYYTDYHALNHMSMTQRWDMQWFTLDTSSRPIPTMDASLVCVTKLPWAATSTSIWPPVKKTYKKRRVGTRSDPAAAHDTPLEHMPVEDDANIHPDHFPDEAEDEREEREEVWEEEGAEPAALAALLDETEFMALEASTTLEAAGISNIMTTEVDTGNEQGTSSNADLSTHALAVPPFPATPHGEIGPRRAVGSAEAMPDMHPDPAQVVQEVPLSPAQPKATGTPRGSTQAASATLAVPGGRISFYVARGAFEAQCGNKAHGKCTLSRTCNGRRRGQAGMVGGRPVAFMALWLARGGCGSKAEHWDRGANNFTQAERRAKRRELEGMDLGPSLLAFERAKAPGEDSEAEDLSGIWP